jgi:hypothetical protein
MLDKIAFHGIACPTQLNFLSRSGRVSALTAGSFVLRLGIKGVPGVMPKTLFRKIEIQQLLLPLSNNS